jgi:hypothetical protein
MEWTASEGFSPSDWVRVTGILAEIVERLDNYTCGRELPYGEMYPVITDEGVLT